MKTLQLVLGFILIVIASANVNATTTVFFDSSQVATLVESGTTFDTISSNGYLFTYTQDKLFTGGGTTPIGRVSAVNWPEGISAQAITTGTVGPAKITIQRVDGNVFDITTFTAELLANTGSTGGAIEVMPKINGVDGLPDPIFFDASGSSGQSFSYGSPATNPLSGYDSYTFSLFVDFALTQITLVDASVPVPVPAAFWLFASGFLSLIGFAKRRL